MGKSNGDVKLAENLGAKLHSAPATEGRRTHPYVDCNVPDGATNNAHQFDLGRRRKLKMQAVGETFGRTWDRMDFELADGTPTTRYFDITGFFGKR